MAQQIAAGANHSLAVCSDGRVMAWGENRYGQLGNGVIDPSAIPLEVQQLDGVTVVAAGQDYSLALKGDGTVWAWGYNYYGQLGDNTILNRRRPVRVGNLSNVVAISSRYYHSLALKSDGSIWAWGENSNGQLGVGDAVDRWTPTRVPVTGNFVAIAAGIGHSLGLRDDGIVFAWGDNSLKQLGNNISGQETLAVQVIGLPPITAIAVGGSHNLALDQNGVVWAWGSNSKGQLGNGTTTTSFAPVSIGSLPSMQSIAAGSEYSLALGNGGSTYTWGENSLGELGTGNTNDTPIPQATGLLGITAIQGGYDHTLAMKQAHQVFAWGSNDNGKLGDGTTTTRMAATAIEVQCPQYYAAPDPVFTRYFQPTTGSSGKWIAGELASSIPLPDGRVLWLFGKSHLSTINNDSIPCDTVSDFVHNCILIQDSVLRDSFITLLGFNSSTGDRSFFQDSSHLNDIYTPLHGYAIDDTLLRVYLMMKHVSGADSAIRIANLNLRQGGITIMTWEDTAHMLERIAFGKSMLMDNGEVYVYGNKSSNNLAYIARQVQGYGQDTLVYYDSAAWRGDIILAKPISSYAVANNFSVFKLNGRYFLVTQDITIAGNGCGKQRNIIAYQSDFPWGPFEHPKLVYTTPDSLGGHALSSFGTCTHPYFSDCDSLLISYDVRDSSYSSDINCPRQCDSIINNQAADGWRPKFIRVPFPLFDDALTLTPPPLANFDFSTQGNTVQFSNGSANFSSLLWDFGDGTTSAEANPAHTYLTTGTYHVLLLAQGCNGLTDSLMLQVGPGVEDPFPSLGIYPNPNHGHFNLVARELGSDSVTVEVCNLLGSRLYHAVFQPRDGALDAEITLPSVAGVYVLRFSNANASVGRRVMVY